MSEFSGSMGIAKGFLTMIQNPDVVKGWQISVHNTLSPGQNKQADDSQTPP